MNLCKLFQVRRGLGLCQYLSRRVAEEQAFGPENTENNKGEDCQEGSVLSPE